MMEGESALRPTFAHMLESSKARGAARTKIMIVLHRFPLSHFSEKGRLLLDFKRVAYRIEEKQLGLPQLRIRKLSGQRKVPVIEDDGEVVSDSTEIALYLERQYPDAPHLLPESGIERNEVLDLEHRIDKILGNFAPVVWFDHASRDRGKLARFLKAEVFGLPSGRWSAGACGSLMQLSRARRVVAKAECLTRELLLDLAQRLSKGPFLTGNEPNLADVAAAGLAFHLKFPRSKHLALPDLAGIGVPGWADDPELTRFFEWRDEMYRRYFA